MKKQNPGLWLILILWMGLALFAWVKPAQDFSSSERRPLAQMPQLTVQNVLSGDYMEDFASYAVDQFPLRESLRQLKAVTSQYLLGQLDNNGIYIADGSAVKMDYPLNEGSVTNAAERFQQLYELYLGNSGNIVFAVVPDKGYYLGEASGHLAMDYQTLFDTMSQELPWATHVDLTGLLGADSYYRTDTHWRQEALFDVARRLAEELNCKALSEAESQLQTLDRDFYGVYFGQAALPMEPDTLHYLTWEGWQDCRVYSHDSGLTTALYDLEKGFGKDPYDLFLSGGVAVQTVTNPQGEPGRSLVVFRDSFGSSLVPLLVPSYETVTLVDTRYIFPDQVRNYVNFENADILMLYSTSVINSSNTLRK